MTHQHSRSYPGHEWSPPAGDLSPIEDISSTMEQEEEAAWLAHQKNGMLLSYSFITRYILAYLLTREADINS